MHIGNVKLWRRSLVGLILVIVLAVVFNYVQIWRGRARIIKQAAEILSADMIRSADSIEYSEHRNGLLRFKIRAEKLLETRQGKNLLQGIEAFDFNPDGTIRNQIRSQKAEYDRDQKVAAFYGDVTIEMGQEVDLKTDSLHYDLKTDIGSTPDRIQFNSRQVTGTARGIRYNQSEARLDLLQDVDLTLISDKTKTNVTLGGSDLRATAERAQYSQGERSISFEGRAQVKSGFSILSGDRIEAIFDAPESNIRSLISRGNSVYEAKDSSSLRILSGERIEFDLADTQGILNRIDVQGGAAFSSKSANEEERLQGGEIHIELDSVQGTLKSIKSEKEVQFRLQRDVSDTRISGGRLEADFVPGGNQLQKIQVSEHALMSIRNGSDAESDRLQADNIRMDFGGAAGRASLKYLVARENVQWESLPREAGPDKSGSRQKYVTAALLELHYSPAADSLESGTASGSVILRELPAGGGKDPAQIRRLSADRVQFSFYPNDSKLRDFFGEGHVQIVYGEPTDPAQGSTAREFRTSSQKMKALFRQADGTAQSITQWENFQYSDGTRTATSGRSEYDVIQGRLILSESPRIIDSTGSTTGDGVEYSQKNKIMQIQGHVRSIIKIEGTKSGSPFLAPSSSSSPNIIMAERMEYWTEEGRVRYTGGVQMLSDNSQVQADTLQIFPGGDRIEAQGRIRHLIPKMSSSVDTEGSTQARRGTNGQTPNNADGEMIRIFSGNLIYTKEMHSIDYGGGVTLESESIRMTSDTLRATMDSQGKRIERATAAGKVLIEQTGRKAKGELADYYFDPGKFVVSGELAEISDPVKGKSAARRLTFFTTDDRIMLESQ